MSGDPLFPACRARCIRQMAVGDGHILHIEESGPPDGLPVLFLHDGPGDGCRPDHRRLFDPTVFRAVMLDQRGAGRSLPGGELEANTTPDLVADLDYVREALGLPGWIVVGTGWGSLLALAYARIFPESVQGLVLSGLFLGSRDEVERGLQGLDGVPPAAGQALLAALPDRDPLLALAGRILGSEPELALPAARLWLDYRRVLAGEPALTARPDAAQLAAARLQMHYLSRDCFLAPGQMLAGIEHIRHLPAVIVQGRADLASPSPVAEQVRRAWPEATWLPVAGAGHDDILSPAIARATIKALSWVAEAVHGCAV